jgi:nicotinate-nucleotide adenylyltransferase
MSCSSSSAPTAWRISPRGGRPGRIAALATIVVANRPGVDPARLAAPPDLGPDARPIRHVTMPAIGIASNELRRRVAEGATIRYQVPRGVEAYIAAQGVVSPRADVTGEAGRGVNCRRRY